MHKQNNNEKMLHVSLITWDDNNSQAKPNQIKANQRSVIVAVAKRFYKYRKIYCYLFIEFSTRQHTFNLITFHFALEKAADWDSIDINLYNGYIDGVTKTLNIWGLCLILERMKI